MIRFRAMRLLCQKPGGPIVGHDSRPQYDHAKSNRKENKIGPIAWRDPWI